MNCGSIAPSARSAAHQLLATAASQRFPLTTAIRPGVRPRSSAKLDSSVSPIGPWRIAA
jgi:hypothetical protein